MQRNLAYVTAKGSGTMMVLSVDIVGDRSADGHEASARSNRKKPSPREEHIDDVGKTDAAFGSKEAARLVETKKSIEALAVNEASAGIQAGIPIAAAEPIRKQRIRCGGLKDLGHLIIPRRFVNSSMRSFGITSP
jgi:acetaldehyde dehydrogenase (acetylating)